MSPRLGCRVTEPEGGLGAQLCEAWVPLDCSTRRRGQPPPRALGLEGRCQDRHQVPRFTNPLPQFPQEEAGDPIGEGDRGTRRAHRLGPAMGKTTQALEIGFKKDMFN